MYLTVNNMKSEIITYNGLTLDLSQILCIRQEDYFYGGKPRMTVIFKTRFEYIKHPGTGKYVKQKFNESVEFGYPDYNTALTIIGEWKDIWQEYLKRQG